MYLITEQNKDYWTPYMLPKKLDLKKYKHQDQYTVKNDKKHSAHLSVFFSPLF